MVMTKIRFFEAHSQMLGIAPKPEPAIQNIPAWWKLQQPFMDNGQLSNGTYQSTVKKCPAILDSITAGYIIKMPIDIYVDTTGNQILTQLPFEFERFRPHIISAHPNQQLSNMPIDTEIYMSDVLRIHPFWLIKTDIGSSTLFMPPVFRENSPILATTAIVDTDKFISDGHLSFFVKKNFKGIIKQGTPLVQVIPFNREKWEHEIHGYNPDIENIQRKVVRSTFLHGYKLKFWTRKEYK
jgi:hypothetical protein